MEGRAPLGTALERLLPASLPRRPAAVRACASGRARERTGALRRAGSPYTLHPHQQPEVDYLPRFSPQLIFLERYTLSVYRVGEIDLFENLDKVHIRLLVAYTLHPTPVRAADHPASGRGGCG